MKHAINEGIEAQYGVGGDGRAHITFHDPAYVCSELIILDRKDRSLHAVLHDSSHLIGKVDKDIYGTFLNQSEVVLSAPHYFSGALHFKTKLVVSG